MSRCIYINYRTSILDSNLNSSVPSATILPASASLLQVDPGNAVPDTLNNPNSVNISPDACTELRSPVNIAFLELVKSGLPVIAKRAFSSTNVTYATFSVPDPAPTPKYWI